MSNFSPGAMTAGLFAILLGLGGAYAVRQHMNQEEAEPAPNDVISVPLAAYDLEPGKRIFAQDILLVDIPRQQVVEQFGTTIFMMDPEMIAGRTVRNKIRQGQPFYSPSFYPAGTGPGIGGLLEPGEVAVTVPMYGVGLVAGFAEPGSVVDILFRSEGEYETTMRLLERVRLLALGNALLRGGGAATRANGQQRDPAVLTTLAVSSYQAQVLKAAENRGELTMVLRNPQDAMTSSFTGDPLLGASDTRVDLEHLLGLPVGERRKTLEMYRGNQRTEFVYDRQPVYDHRNYIPTPVADSPPLRPGGNRRMYSDYRVRSVTRDADPLDNYSTVPPGYDRDPAVSRPGSAAYDRSRRVDDPGRWVYSDDRDRTP